MNYESLFFRKPCESCSRSASCAYKLPKCYIFTGNLREPTSDVHELRCCYSWYKSDLTFPLTVMPHEGLEHVKFSDSRQFLDVDMYRELDYKHAVVRQLFAST
jgi:hypothetical protein